MTDSAGDRKVARLSRAGVLLLRLLASTWRVRVINDIHIRSQHERGRPVIYVLWHGELLPLLWTHRKRQIAVMISEHRDGEFIARVAAALGFRSVRGSTTRGAARALLGACRELEQGYDIAVTPDGPRGPAHSIAPGAQVISHRTGVAMVPVCAAATRAWRLRSWDRFLIPKPFARVTVAYAEPVFAGGESARDAATESEALRAALERAGASAERGR